MRETINHTIRIKKQMHWNEEYDKLSVKYVNEMDKSMCSTHAVLNDILFIAMIWRNCDPIIMTI